MRLFQLCYAALGFAVARWIFKRQSKAVIAPDALLGPHGPK